MDMLLPKGLSYCRFIDLGCAVTEVDMIGLHTKVIDDNDVKRGVVKTVQMLVLNKLVMRPRRIPEAEDAGINADEVVFLDSVAPVSHSCLVPIRAPAMTGDRVTRQRHGGDLCAHRALCREIVTQSDDMDVSPTDNSTPDFKGDMVDLVRMRNQYCVNTIPPEYFIDGCEVID